MQQSSENQGFAGLILDYIQKLEADALATQEKLNQDGRSPLRRFGENLVFGTPEYEGAEEGIASNLALAPVRSAVMGGTAVKQGIENNDPVQAIGGGVLAGSSVLPFSSKIASQLFSNANRIAATSGGLTTAGLAAQGAFKPSEAYAQGEKSTAGEIFDKLNENKSSYLLSVGAPLLGGAFSSALLKTILKNKGHKAQQEIADINNVAANRRATDRARASTDDDHFIEALEREFRNKTPAKYQNTTADMMEGPLLNKPLKDIDNVDAMDGSLPIFAGLGGGLIHAGVNSDNEDYSILDSIGTGALAALGAMAPPLGGGPRVKNVQQNIKPVEHHKIFNDYAPVRSPIKNSYDGNIRKAVVKKLRQGMSPKELEKATGVSETTIRRWGKKDD